LPSKRCKL